MITQASWIQNIVIDPIRERGQKEHLHFGHTLPDVTVIQVSHNECGFTAGERQAWTNYENIGN